MCSIKLSSRPKLIKKIKLSIFYIYCKHKQLKIMMPKGPISQKHSSYQRIHVIVENNFSPDAASQRCDI